MKTIKNIFILAIITTIITFPSCSSDDSSDTDISITIDEKLAGSWSISSVRLDGADVTGDFSGFGVTLNSNGNGSNSGSYTVNGGYNLLDGSGSYSVNGTSSLSLSTNQGNNITVSIELSNDDNTLSFSFFNPTTTFGGGRINGTAGDYVFVLNK